MLAPSIDIIEKILPSKQKNLQLKRHKRKRDPHPPKKKMVNFALFVQSPLKHSQWPSVITVLVRNVRFVSELSTILAIVLTVRYVVLPLYNEMMALTINM